MKKNKYRIAYYFLINYTDVPNSLLGLLRSPDSAVTESTPSLWSPDRVKQGKASSLNQNSCWKVKPSKQLIPCSQLKMLCLYCSKKLWGFVRKWFLIFILLVWDFIFFPIAISRGHLTGLEVSLACFICSKELIKCLASLLTSFEHVEFHIPVNLMF